MVRKYDVDCINLKIDKVDFWGENKGNDGGIRVYWSSDIGFGTLDIIKPRGGDNNNSEDLFGGINLHCCTEGMDIQDDKRFTKKIFSLLLDELIIVD